VNATSPKKRTLLYVDDDENTLVLMTEIFSSENYNVITKLSGEEGLKYIEENEPVSLVISGFIMRGRNGLEFLKQVKANSLKTKLCLCSGSFDRGTLDDKVKDHEMDGFFMKPVLIDKMLNTINGAKSHCQLKLNNASRHFNNIFFKIQVLHCLSEFSEMAIPSYSS
jgi:DNA-binding NtrC family response regulator